MTALKVSTQSRSAAVAGSIAGLIREHKPVAVHAIGAGAVNQAIKAVIIARGYLKQDGLDLVCVPAFVELDIDSVKRTAIKLSVESRPFAEETEGQRHAASA